MQSYDLIGRVVRASDYNATLRDRLPSCEVTFVSSTTSGKLAFESDRALNQTVHDIAEKLKTLGDNISDKLEPLIYNLQETTNDLSLTIIIGIIINIFLFFKQTSK